MLSVLIPTKEEPLIQELVNQLHKDIDMDHEVIIIDESVQTPKVKGARVLKQKSHGLGNAFLEGLEVAKGNLIAIMDGDFSHDTKDLARMVKLTDNYDIVVGSKLVKGGKTEDRALRKIVTISIGTITRIITDLDIKDPMTGFAVMRRKVLDNITLRPRGYKIVLETMYKAKQQGFSIYEAPITFHKRKAGESKMGFNLKGIRELLRIMKLSVDLRRNKV